MSDKETQQDKNQNSGSSRSISYGVNPRAIIFDIDSTLTLSKQPMSEEMGEALKNLLEKMPVAVMSGADLPQFEKQFLSHLPPGARLENLFLFPTSSAECLAYKDGKWQDAYDLVFTPEEKQLIYKAFEEALAETHIVDNDPHFGKRLEDRGEQITFSGLGQEAPLELKEKWDPTHEKRAALKALLLERLPSFEISIGGTTSIDITKKGVDKAYGIHWLEKRLGLKPEEMVYVGDAIFEGGNDAAAINTGIKLQPVTGPEETLKFINSILSE